MEAMLGWVFDDQQHVVGALHEVRHCKDRLPIILQQEFNGVFAEQETRKGLPPRCLEPPVLQDALRRHVAESDLLMAMRQGGRRGAPVVLDNRHEA